MGTWEGDLACHCMHLLGVSSIEMLACLMMYTYLSEHAGYRKGTCGHSMLKVVDGDMIDYTFKNFHLKYSIDKLTGSGGYMAKLLSPDCR